MDQSQLHHQRLQIILYTNTLFSKFKSKQGSTCDQKHVTDFNFFNFSGLKSKKLACTYLAKFLEHFGVTCQLNSYNAKELTIHPQCWHVTEKQDGIRTNQIETMSLL